MLTQLQRARRSIQNEFRRTLLVPEHLLRLALNEAEALAWQTDVPHLVFPTLATEKVQALKGWDTRQQFIRRASARPRLGS